MVIPSLTDNTTWEFINGDSTVRIRSKSIVTLKNVVGMEWTVEILYKFTHEGIF